MRNSRTSWIASAAIVLLLVASGSGLFRSFAPAEIDSAQAARRAAVGGLIGLGVAAAIVIVWMRKGDVRRAAGVGGVAGVVAAVALLVTLSAATGASTATSPPGPDDVTIDDRPPPTIVPSTVVTDTIAELEPVDEDPGPDLSWIGTLVKLLLVAVIGALVVKAALMLRRHRRSLAELAAHEPTFVQPVAPDEPEIDQDGAADSFAASARTLLADGDPRRAIIAAYAALLEGLEAAGAGRRPHEGPEEHLRRSLHQLRIPSEALAEVTRLFLVAKFSTHPLGEPDRDQARAMLAVAEDHLRALEPSR